MTEQARAIGRRAAGGSAGGSDGKKKNAVPAVSLTTTDPPTVATTKVATRTKHEEEVAHYPRFDFKRGWALCGRGVTRRWSCKKR